AVTGDGGKYRQFGEIGTGNGHHQSTKRRESQGYAKAVLHTIRAKRVACCKYVAARRPLIPVKLS
ncbi:MAG: hypothetical protein ACRDDO_06325, partial [Plesiomonas shigelloides]